MAGPLSRPPSGRASARPRDSSYTSIDCRKIESFACADAHALGGRLKGPAMTERLLRWRAVDCSGKRLARALFRQIQMQRRHRDAAVVDGAQIGTLRRIAQHPFEAEPIIRVPARV